MGKEESQESVLGRERAGFRASLAAIGHAFSLSSQGSARQFAAGLALAGVIPLLSLGVLSLNSLHEGTGLDAWDLFYIAAAGVSALGGILLLRQYPQSIVRLRQYLEAIAQGTLPRQVSLPENMSDIQAIQESMNRILNILRVRLAVAQTEKSGLEEHLHRMQKTESLGVMAGGVAHDFNNFLTIIRTRVGILQEELAGQPALLESIGEIQDATRDAAALARQMLICAGQESIQPARVEIRPLVDEIIGLLRTTAGKNVRIETDVASDTCLDRADAAQVRQIVMNLIINAAEAIGEKDGQIRLSAENVSLSEKDMDGMYPPDNIRAGEYVSLSVEDNGCGMDAATLSRLFDPFFTTKKDGKGLGLAVVLGVVRSHGGLVKVSSELERGTKFRILLPVVLRPGTTSVPIAASASPAAAAPEPSPGRSGRRRVLVFDDDESIRHLFSMILKMLDYEVYAYANCHGFCTKEDCVNKDRPGCACADYIICDVFMNGTSGIDLAEKLARKQCRVRNIALVSGRWTEADRQRARAIGSSVFNKPVAAEEIALWLEGCSTRIPHDRVLTDHREVLAPRNTE